jgi:hydroxymethylpyrimidine/phosphomethylpyrimidine kinase
MITGNERVSVLFEIEQQLEILRRTDFAKLIPEVGSNLAYALKNPEDAKDVAAIPGRIRNAMGRPVFLKPMFGASKHVASMIIGAMQHDPEKRCALNIRQSPEIIDALKSMGLKTVFVDRMQEPDDVKNKEGSSVPWVLEKAYEKFGKVPDAIYHSGAVGKEAITIILGKNPAQVAGIAVELLKKI